MAIPKKQLKITKLFKRTATRLPKEDECDELQEEVRQLEQRLQEKQNQWFQVQRNLYRAAALPPKKKDISFVRPQKIMLQNSIESLKRNLEVITMLTGIEVQSYVVGEHCCVMFHMQHPSEHAVSHGLRIDMSSGKNEVSAFSLPLGFNMAAVMEEFDNVMNPNCLGAIRKALLAYYDRHEQIKKLLELIKLGGEVFKTLDCSHIEISMLVQAANEDQIPMTLMLDYRVYDIRPKVYAVKELDLPEGAVDTIKEQCAVFKKKPLRKAFKEAFMTGNGLYRLAQQLEPHDSPTQRKRFRPTKHQHGDDTFQPEDCSDQGEDDEDID